MNKNLFSPQEICTPKHVKAKLWETFKAYDLFRKEFREPIPKEGGSMVNIPGVDWQVMERAWQEGMMWSLLLSPYTKDQCQNDWEKGGMTPVRPEPPEVANMDVGGTIGHQFEYKIKVNTWEGTICVIPEIRPTKMAQKFKNRLRANLDISMAAPNGEVITNVIDLKSLDRVTYFNYDKTQKVKFGKGENEVQVMVTRCNNAMFERVQQRCVADRMKVPRKVNNYDFPGPHTEDGIRMVEEGPLPPEEGHEKKKRKLRDDANLCKPEILRMLSSDLEMLNGAISKVLERGFVIKQLMNSEVRDEDFTFQKVVAVLRMVKDGKNPFGWKSH